ncbi:cold-shock protein [Aminobacter sp. LjRoot7]|uniref:cold-shock protein n=1 Tax=Aminobacter sp. LjRoot7 TaxID=3342335 RepID=UPI003F5076FB
MQDEHGPEPSYFQRPIVTTSPSIEAEVLWFNAQKGFGFIKLTDGSDAYLHIRTLEAAGHHNVSEGMRLQVRIEAGPRGPQVVQVLTVSGGAERLPSTGLPTRPNLMGAARPEAGEQESAGTGKWYDGDKGFGFISLESGGKDVFVHASALPRSGLTKLEEGQKVVVRYARGQKGLEARTIHPG